MTMGNHSLEMGWSIGSIADLHVWEKLNVSSDGMPINQGSY